MLKIYTANIYKKAKDIKIFFRYRPLKALKDRADNIKYGFTFMQSN